MWCGLKYFAAKTHFLNFSILLSGRTLRIAHSEAPQVLPMFYLPHITLIPTTSFDYVFSFKVFIRIETEHYVLSPVQIKSLLELLVQCFAVRWNVQVDKQLLGYSQKLVVIYLSSFLHCFEKKYEMKKKITDFDAEKTWSHEDFENTLWNETRLNLGDSN